VSVPPEVPAERVAAFLGDAVTEALTPRLSGFLGIAETQALLDEIDAIAPALVRQVVPKPVSLPVLAEVLRRLVDERVGIRDLRTILEALAGAGSLDKDALGLAEFVRAQLRRQITFSLVGSGRELAVMVLDSPLEETIRTSIQRTPAGSFLALAPAAARDIVLSVRRAVETWPSPARPTLLAQPDIRRFVRKLLEVELPLLDVVSPVELTPELTIRAVTRATLG
jgi:type III secretion protein V